MGLVLLLGDAKRFSQAFFRKSAVVLPPDYRPIPAAYDKAIRVFKIFGLSLIVIGAVALRGLIYVEQSKDTIRDEFYGIWEVKHFIKNGDTIPPLTTASHRWRYMVMQSKDRTTIKYINDSLTAYHFKADSTRNHISIYQRDSTESLHNFSLISNDSTQLKFKGFLATDSLEVHLKAKDLKDFTLINRGFHWVNEAPFNR